MARKSKVSAEQKVLAVLSVLKQESSAVEAGRRLGVAEQTIHNWKRAFLESGAQGLASGKQRSRSQREAELVEEVEELKAALGETVAELRVVKRGQTAYEILRSSR